MLTLRLALATALAPVADDELCHDGRGTYRKPRRSFSVTASSLTSPRLPTLSNRYLSRSRFSRCAAAACSAAGQKAHLVGLRARLRMTPDQPRRAVADRVRLSIERACQYGLARSAASFHVDRADLPEYAAGATRVTEQPAEERTSPTFSRPTYIEPCRFISSFSGKRRADRARSPWYPGAPNSAPRRKSHLRDEFGDQVRSYRPCAARLAGLR